MPILRSVDAERLADLAGAVRGILSGQPTILFDDVDAFQRFDGTDEHAGALAFFSADDVAAVVHAVGEVDIEVPGAPEHGAVPLCFAAEGVACFVRLVICFRFNDTHAYGSAVQFTDKLAAQEPPSRFFSRYRKPGEGERCHISMRAKATGPRWPARGR